MLLKKTSYTILEKFFKIAPEGKIDKFSYLGRFFIIGIVTRVLPMLGMLGLALTAESYTEEDFPLWLTVMGMIMPIVMMILMTIGLYSVYVNAYKRVIDFGGSIRFLQVLMVIVSGIIILSFFELVPGEIGDGILKIGSLYLFLYLSFKNTKKEGLSTP